MTETGWIYVRVDPESAGSALNTLLVDDLDAFMAGLAERGIATAAVELNAASVRVTTVTDPDGNRLQLGQVPA